MPFRKIVFLNILNVNHYQEFNENSLKIRQKIQNLSLSPDKRKTVYDRGQKANSKKGQIVEYVTSSS